MPVEIREISLNLTLLAESDQENTEKGMDEHAPTLSAELQRTMIDTCVRSVLRILRDKNEQ